MQQPRGISGNIAAIAAQLTRPVVADLLHRLTSGLLLIRPVSLVLVAVEQKNAPVTEFHFLWLPSRPLVVFLTVLTGLVGPIEVGILIGNPLLDSPPWGLDTTQGFDVEGWRGRSWQSNQSLPQTVEFEEKFNLARFEHRTHDFHGAFAAGAIQGVPSPDLQDEIAPQGSHFTSSSFGRRLHEE